MRKRRRKGKMRREEEEREKEEEEVLCTVELIHILGRGCVLVESMPFDLEGRGFEYCSSRHVRNLGKSFACNCL